jgi:hypothetical protein
MHEVNRRSLLKILAALPFAPYRANGDEKPQAVHLVEAAADRTGEPHKAARANTHLDFNVLTRETNGALFIMENRNMVRGGPSRHIHYARLRICTRALRAASVSFARIFTQPVR